MTETSEYNSLKSPFAKLQAAAAVAQLKEYDRACTLAKDYIPANADVLSHFRRNEDFHRSNQYIIIDLIAYSKETRAREEEINKNLDLLNTKMDNLLVRTEALEKISKSKGIQDDSNNSIVLLRTEVGGLSAKVDALVDKIERNPDEPWMKEITQRIGSFQIDLAPVEKQLGEVKKAINTIALHEGKNIMPEFGTTRGKVSHDWTTVPYKKK